LINGYPHNWTSTWKRLEGMTDISGGITGIVLPPMSNTYFWILFGE
jgi:hypothetical protein